MPSYDPNLIQQHAKRLYGQAVVIAILYALLGIFGGLLLAFLAKSTLGKGPISRDLPLELIVTAICGLLGFLTGYMRGFDLRLQAQVALCQLQIEINTRQVAQAIQAVVPGPGAAGPVPPVGGLTPTQPASDLPGYPQQRTQPPR